MPENQNNNQNTDDWLSLDDLSNIINNKPIDESKIESTPIIDITNMPAQNNDHTPIIPQNNNSNPEIVDININSIDDLLFLYFDGDYDLISLDPKDGVIKISFKQKWTLKDTKYIKYNIYTNILIQTKNVGWLDLVNTSDSQVWKWKYKFRDQDVEVAVKTEPTPMGERLFLKVRTISQAPIKAKWKQKNKLSPGQIFSYLAARLFISLILGWAFLTFVVFNAKTPDDVVFFRNLGVDLNDINNFIMKLTTLIFSIVIIVEVVIFSLTLFKALFTKKSFKKKRTILYTLAAVLMIFTFSTGWLWMFLDQKIRQLPNWLELSYGIIQIYDNNLLNDENTRREDAFITDTKTLIWPIELKFDVENLKNSEAKKSFRVDNFIWNFWDGVDIKTQSTSIVHNFDKRWNYTITLTLEWVDLRSANRETIERPLDAIQTISVEYIVNIQESTTNDGWTLVSFDASNLKPLWDIDWYLSENPKEPAFTGFEFKPSKIYYDKESIGMKIKNSDESGMDRIFIISGSKSNIDWEIQISQTWHDDLNYTFGLKDLQNDFGWWFIEQFIWNIDWDEVVKKADVLNIEWSSKIEYRFKRYWEKSIQVRVINSAWNSAVLSTSINIKQKPNIDKPIAITIDWELQNKVNYNENAWEYYLYNVWVPANIKFDTTNLKTDISNYVIDSVDWDIDRTWKKSHTWRIFETEFVTTGTKTVWVTFNLKNLRDDSDRVSINQNIIFDLWQKEAVLSLDIKPDSLYVPTIVRFDATKSRIQDDDIVKFIYNYGDGTPEEERWGINPWHKYTKAWSYTVSLEVVTQKWKRYTIHKPLVLNSPENMIRITTSLKNAPVWQEINFYSTSSQWHIEEYFWDFWDGHKSTEANPAHHFDKPGEYKVTLTLTFTNNNVDSDYVLINIKQ